MHPSLKLLIGIGLLLLIAASGYGVLFAMIRANGAHASDVGSNLAREVERERQLKTLATVLEDLVAERMEILSRVAEADDIVALIQSIEDLSAVAGVDLVVQNARLEETSSGDTKSAKQMSAELSTAGSWSATTHFLLLLETLPVRLDMSRVSLDNIGASAEKRATWNGLFSITVPVR